MSDLTMSQLPGYLFADVPNVPVQYMADFLPAPEGLFGSLWNELNWEHRVSTPRREYYCNDISVPYTYGRGAGERTYQPQPWHPTIKFIRKGVEMITGVTFEVCFLNGYADGSDQLGWHADDSPEMDDERPIAVVSLGARREIWFCPQSDKKDVTKLWLDSGSLCLMAPGMQDTHYHRIPKSSVHNCGPRVSLTFRGYRDIGSHPIEKPRNIK